LTKNSFYISINHAAERLTAFMVGFILLLGGVLPVLFLSSVPGRISSNFLLLYAVVLWCTLRLAMTAIEGEKRLVMIFFYVFVYVFLGLQPLVSTWSGVFPHKELAITDSIYLYTTTIVIMGIVAFEAGYYRWSFSTRSNAPAKMAWQQGRIDIITVKNLGFLALVISGLIVLSILVYGIGIYLSLRDAAMVTDFEVRAMSGTEAQLVINGLRALLAIVLFLALYKKKIDKLYLVKSSRKLKFMIWYLVFMNIIISNPLNAPRLWAGSIVLTCFFISFRWQGRKSFFSWALGVILALLLLFSGTDPRRIISQTLVRGDDITVGSVAQSVVEGVASLPYDTNFDAYQIITYTIVYTSDRGFSYGRQLLLPVFFWIPRSVWPSKPIGTSDVVGEHAGFFNVNVSSPLWAEGYINFGIVGIALFLFLFGRLARISDKQLMHAETRPGFQTVVSSYFAANTFILLRGDLTSGTMYLQMICVFSLIFLWFAGRKARIAFPINTNITEI